MWTKRSGKRPCLGGMLAILAASVIAAQPAWGQEKLLPGAKLLHKFPDEVYRIPTLLETQQGPRLLLWIDAFDPAPKPRFPADTMPAPKFDLVFWDMKANKEAHKMTFPKDAAPLSPVPAGMNSPLASDKFGTLALSPDAKRLAAVSTVYPINVGKFQQPTTYIKLYDPAAGKWTQAHAFAGQDGPHMQFAPDGALVILKERWWAIQKPEETKLRKHKLTRSPFYAPKPNAYSVYSIRNAALSSEGAYLAVAADGLVTVYDTNSATVVVKAKRAVPDSKGTTFGQNTDLVELAFASGKDPVLLAVETVTGAPKSFVLARVFDVKTRKETSRRILAEEPTKASAFGGAPLPNWSRPAAYFNAKGEPRVLFNGKLLDAVSGKTLHTFESGYAAIVSRDGSYLVRLTQKQGDKRIGVEIWSLDNSL